MSFISNLFDTITGKSPRVDNFHNLQVAETRRILGSNLGAVDTGYTYSITTANDGSITSATGATTLATNTSANGSATLMTLNKIRHLSGRNNNLRIAGRVGDTGTLNNIKEFGLYIDSNNQFNFRLSGTVFSVVAKRAGVETVVTSGSLNGNGSAANGVFNIDTNFHAYEILYNQSRIRFIADETAVHTFAAGTTSLTSSMVGQMYVSNTNVSGSTTNTIIDLLAAEVFMVGSTANNPFYYNYNSIVETRTLKSGGGTLQSVTIGHTGGANATLIIYDSTSASGNIIAIFDLDKATANQGTHLFGAAGVNFYNGLTYITSGTTAGANVTFLWD